MGATGNDDVAAFDNVIRVEHKDGDLFEVAVRGHLVHVDQPVADGGTDVAPTPTELFVAGLVACVAFYARRYLVRHSLPTAGLSVTGSFAMGDHPARVGAIDVRLRVPEGVPDARRAGLLAVASHCTVHNSLRQVPALTIELTPRS